MSIRSAPELAFVDLSSSTVLFASPDLFNSHRAAIDLTVACLPEKGINCGCEEIKKRRSAYARQGQQGFKQAEHSRDLGDDIGISNLSCTPSV
jgi:hypothetical protein